VIRRSGRVSAATRQRVLDSIEALGYRPNSLARDLVRRRANTIGVLVGDLANTFYAELAKLFEVRASDAEYTMIVCNTDGDPGLELGRVETLLERGVSGVVMLQFSGHGPVLDQLSAARVPVVVVSCWEERTDCVAVDDHAGMAAAVEHLYDLGHRRIAHVTGPLLEESTRASRYAGFERAMRAHGLEPQRLDAATWEGGDPGAARQLRELVRQPGGITAFAAGNDIMAVRLIDALEGEGLLVPRDVSVVGFDGIELAGYARIGLTTVSQPRSALAAHGLALLTERMRPQPVVGPPRHVQIAPQLVVRHSTAPPGRG
jgi:LacI family transcriptional regulator